MVTVVKQKCIYLKFDFYKIIYSRMKLVSYETTQLWKLYDINKFHMMWTKSNLIFLVAYMSNIVNCAQLKSGHVNYPSKSKN